MLSKDLLEKNAMKKMNANIYYHKLPNSVRRGTCLTKVGYYLAYKNKLNITENEMTKKSKSNSKIRL